MPWFGKVVRVYVCTALKRSKICVWVRGVLGSKCGVFRNGVIAFAHLAVGDALPVPCALR